MSKKIILVLIVSLLIRLIGIDQSLWLDEAISVNVAKNYSLTEIPTKFSKSDFHPPLYYLTLKTWTNVVGYSEVGVRMLSVIMALITIVIIYKIGGIGPAMLVGFNPLLVYYSQEARMYSMATMLATIAIYFFVKKKYLWTGLFLGIGFLTFYGSIFLAAGLTLYLLFNKQYKETIKLNWWVVVAIGINWPLMQQQLKNSAEMLATVTNWDLVLGKVNIKNLLLIPMKFTSGRISFEPKIIYYVISGVWAIFVMKSLSPSGLLPLKKGRSELSQYLWMFWLTLGVGIVFSIFTPMMQYFRFLYLIPIMCLAIGKNKIIAGGFLVFSLVYVLNPNFYREDWKSLVNDLPDKVYMIESFRDPVVYYNSVIQISDLRSQFLEQEVTVVPYGEEIHGVDHEKILTEQDYVKIEEISYRQLSMEKWQKLIK